MPALPGIRAFSIAISIPDDAALSAAFIADADARQAAERKYRLLGVATPHGLIDGAASEGSNIASFVQTVPATLLLAHEDAIRIVGRIQRAAERHAALFLPHTMPCADALASLAHVEHRGKERSPSLGMFLDAFHGVADDADFRGFGSPRMYEFALILPLLPKISPASGASAAAALTTKDAFDIASSRRADASFRAHLMMGSQDNKASSFRPLTARAFMRDFARLSRESRPIISFHALRRLYAFHYFRRRCHGAHIYSPAESSEKQALSITRKMGRLHAHRMPRYENTMQGRQLTAFDAFRTPCLLSPQLFAMRAVRYHFFPRRVCRLARERFHYRQP